MERKLNSAVIDFVCAIKNSPEYREFAIQQDKIRQYPELKEQIDDYRQKNFLLQTSVEQEELFDKIDEFQKEYEAFREDPLVSDFLAAELAFCRMMQEAGLHITEMLGFD